MPDDIRKILADWPYNPGELTVRKITGADGREKIQMRLDLGLLQMEMAGRPDGQRPKGRESLLHYHLDQVEQHRQRNGTELGFELDAQQCAALRAEAVMYYHRYLSLFVLEEYNQVERDTGHNLQVLDMLRRFAATQNDRMAFQQYRPYLIMMNTRAKAHRALQTKANRSAMAHIDAGLVAIREFFEAYDQPEAIGKSTEAMILLALRQQVVEQLPGDPVAKLEQELDSAVREERYEDAARLRDRISQLRRQEESPS